MKAELHIKAQNLDIGYGKGSSKTLVAKNVNFELEQGKLYGLIGVNGAGKSTLLKTLCGSLLPLSGDILLNEKNLTRLSAIDKARLLSVVLTKSPVSLNLSCFELIALGRQPYTNWIGVLRDSDHEIIAKAMKITDTANLAAQKCYELSDGQLQRALLARAIAQDTPAILLDEPTTHLDLNHKFKMLQLLHRLTQDGKTILFSTHDIALALDLCDRLLVVQNDTVSDYSPQEAIDARIIEKMFPAETVKFDPKSRRFTLNK